MSEFARSLAIAAVPTVVAQLGEAWREHLTRRAEDRRASRARWEQLIAEARAEREEYSGR